MVSVASGLGGTSKVTPMEPRIPAIQSKVPLRTPIPPWTLIPVQIALKQIYLANEIEPINIKNLIN